MDERNERNERNQRKGVHEKRLRNINMNRNHRLGATEAIYT